ncbi:hypothetical protein RB213_010047 [Colletotrichum asianum]
MTSRGFGASLLVGAAFVLSRHAMPSWTWHRVSPFSMWRISNRSPRYRTAPPRLMGLPGDDHQPFTRHSLLLNPVSVIVRSYHVDNCAPSAV